MQLREFIYATTEKQNKPHKINLNKTFKRLRFYRESLCDFGILNLKTKNIFSAISTLLNTFKQS